MRFKTDYYCEYAFFSLIRMTLCVCEREGENGTGVWGKQVKFYKLYLCGGNSYNMIRFYTLLHRFECEWLGWLLSMAQAGKTSL